MTIQELKDIVLDTMNYIEEEKIFNPEMAEEEAINIFVNEYKDHKINVNPIKHEGIMHEIAYLVAVSFCLANEKRCYL